MDELQELIKSQRKDDTFSVKKQYNALPFKENGSSRIIPRREIRTPITFPEHGTASRYHVYKCRCKVCQRWRRDYARLERQRQGIRPRKPYID